MIDRIAVAGHTVDWLVDLGTGTDCSLMQVCARPEAYALATDIDPVAIEVAEDNASSTASRWAGNPVNAR